MTGQELFDKYRQRDFSGSVDDVYGQLLMTIFMNIGSDMFDLLEQAERKNMRLEVDDNYYPEGVLYDEISKDMIKFVKK
ncbi:hypothetical protein EIM50_24340 [Pseudoxanthomonas sp. SGD-10]|nr:hypothetical protein EIM50_24340 [Pseudoxanthomonas sp. SGD-10]